MDRNSMLVAVAFFAMLAIVSIFAPETFNSKKNVCPDVKVTETQK